jgi:hypothetical protein
MQGEQTMPTFTISLPARPQGSLNVTPRDALTVLALTLIGLLVTVVTLTVGHMGLLQRMPVFQGAQQIQGVTEFLSSIKGYLLSIVLGGFTVALVGAGAAKLMGHTRANDLIFNIGVGVAIFASIPTLVA